MKYLALYENFNEYYRHVSYEEANDFFYLRRRVRFTGRQIDILQAFNTLRISTLYSGVPSNQISIFFQAKRNSDKFERFYFRIQAYDDEYFRVRCHSLDERNPGMGPQVCWYLCDGFDGLIKLLEDSRSGKIQLSPHPNDD